MTTVPPKSDDEKYRQQQIIEKTIGPTPWYWNTFPVITSPSGEQFSFHYHSDRQGIEYLVTFGPKPDPEHPRLALNTYCRPFLMSKGRVGVWAPEGREIRLLCFEPESLKPFAFLEVAGWFKQSTDRIYAATAPVAEFTVPSALAAGTHKVEVPSEFREIDELLLVNSYPMKSTGDPAFAVFVVYPQAGLVEVLPQKWFTGEKFDLRQQWITRVARDPGSHRIIGDGIRTGSFELSENGMELGEWL